MGIHALDETRRKGLDDGDVPLVEGQYTYNVQTRSKHTSIDRSQSHTEILGQAWINANSGAVPLAMAY
jgi:hypothetical protein